MIARRWPWLLLGAWLAACAGPPGRSDPCQPLDPVLASAAFVLVVEPVAGARATSPLRVRGCSRTFESNVVWELRSRAGTTLAAGHTSGGGVSGADAFSFEVFFRVAAPATGPG